MQHFFRHIRLRHAPFVIAPIVLASLVLGISVARSRSEAATSSNAAKVVNAPPGTFIPEWVIYRDKRLFLFLYDSRTGAATEIYHEIQNDDGGLSISVNTAPLGPLGNLPQQGSAQTPPGRYIVKWVRFPQHALRMFVHDTTTGAYEMVVGMSLDPNKVMTGNARPGPFKFLDGTYGSGGFPPLPEAP